MKQDFSEFGIVKENISLKSYNTYKIGGICKLMISPRTIEELRNLILFLKKNNMNFFILGNGSNIIFSESEFSDVVIHLNLLNRISYEKNTITVEAGVLMPALAMDSIHHGLCGLEWATGIPGSVGGCIYGNAEAYKISTFDILTEVLVLTPEFDVVLLKKSEVTYGYRTSFFKNHKDYIILEAHFELAYGDKEESLALIKKRKKKRQMTQPIEYPSAGSVFRNPPDYEPSGKLIEDIGLKGLRSGGGEVSQKHANFIINKENATSNDIKNLIELVHDKVLIHYGIDLVMEQEYVGWE